MNDRPCSSTMVSSSFHRSWAINAMLKTIHRVTYRETCDGRAATVFPREMRFGRGGRGRWRVRRVPLAVLAVILAGLVIWTVHEGRKPGPWQRVFATREGLVGGRLATGRIIGA